MYFVLGLDTLPDLVIYMEVAAWTDFFACGSTSCWDTLVGDFSGLDCLWHCTRGVCLVLSIPCILSMSASIVYPVVFNSSVYVVLFGGCGSVSGRMWRRLCLYSFPSDSTTYERGSSHFRFPIPTLSCPFFVCSLITWFGARGRSGLLVLS